MRHQRVHYNLIAGPRLLVIAMIVLDTVCAFSQPKKNLHLIVLCLVSILILTECDSHQAALHTVY